jgi:hypothetical protein
MNLNIKFGNYWGSFSSCSEQLSITILGNSFVEQVWGGRKRRQMMRMRMLRRVMKGL